MIDDETRTCYVFEYQFPILDCISIYTYDSMMVAPFLQIQRANKGEIEMGPDC